MSSQPIKNRGYACLGVVVLGVWFGGCAVGPNYRRPAIDSPSVFGHDPAATNTAYVDLNWWQFYRDDILQALVREALTNDYDLRIAVTRVEQSRTVAMQARAQFLAS